ncbi:MAG: ATP-binding protein [Planctomycetota bacterium]|jgi:signal transduction histidine kinase
MEDLSLHILDIAENSIAAEAKRIEVRIEEDQVKDLLTIEIKDDGRGMDEETLRRVLDPFFTTRTTRRVGLGLPLLAQASRESDGTIEIDSNPGQGTAVKATFRYRHLDRKPLGNIHETIQTLVAGHPEIDFLFEHTRDGSRYSFDTREIGKR